MGVLLHMALLKKFHGNIELFGGKIGLFCRNINAAWVSPPHGFAT